VASVGFLFTLNYDAWNHELKKKYIFFFPMPPHVLVDFVVFPPGHDRNVTDF